MARDRHRDLAEYAACLFEILATAYATNLVGPDPLSRLDRSQGGAAALGEPQELGASMARILHMVEQPVLLEDVSHALHALSGQAERTRNLSDRSRRFFHAREHPPALAGLSCCPSQSVASGGKESVQSEDTDDKRAEAIAGARTHI